MHVFCLGQVEHEPVEGIDIRLESSRNQGGNEVDFIEQPTGPTDAKGSVIASIWSSTPGELQLRVTANGAVLCERWENGECVPLQVMMTFVE